MCAYIKVRKVVIPFHAMKTYRRIKLIAPFLLTLMWDGGKWSASCSGCFTPRESTSSTHWKGGRVGHSQPGCYGQDKIILLPPGINSQLPPCVNLLKPYLHTDFLTAQAKCHTSMSHLLPVLSHTGMELQILHVYWLLIIKNIKYVTFIIFLKLLRN